MRFIISLCIQILLIENLYSNIIHIPKDYTAIQTAIAVASNGDTILVDPGVYPGNINFAGKDIIIGSLMLITDSLEYVSQTVITADTGSIVTFSNGETSSAVLCGFTLNNGTGKKDAGGELGGAVYINNASPVIRNNYIARNVAGNGTCDGKGGGVSIKNYSNPLIIRNTITNNRASGPCLIGDYRGGGIWVDSTSNPVIGGNYTDANNIYDNQADFGRAICRSGSGQVINARYNYWGTCPPDSLDLLPKDQFDVSGCLQSPAEVQIDTGILTPARFFLFQNYPNPFNPKTTFTYTVGSFAHVSIKIFDLLGREVYDLVNGLKNPGKYEIEWNAQNLRSGVYFARITSGSYRGVKKIILMN